LKILFPFVGDSVGGSHHSIILLHKELSRSNITSSILLHQKGPLSSFLDEIGVNYEFLQMDHFAGDTPNVFLIMRNVLKNSFKIHNYIKNNKITLVHGNDLRINLSWSFPTKISKVTYVWHQRTIMSSAFYWKIPNLFVDHFIAISDYVYSTLPINIHNSKKSLILNPFDTRTTYDKKKSRSSINIAYSISEDDLVIGYIGRLIEWKNIDFLIKCFAELKNNYSKNLRLLIAGSGSVEYVSFLEGLVAKLNLNDSVVFCGFTSKPNQVIAGFDLMVAPSNIEPFGRTLVEAMLQKTPVIAAKGGGHSEIIQHGLNGLLYNHNDVDDFIIQINKYIGNLNITSSIDKAYLYSCSNYSSSEHFKSVIKVYKQL
jgi:glycosyltransferase involved in cell wall biosynthesis